MTIYMLANQPLNFQKGIVWVAQVKPEMGRRVLLESVNGKSPPVTQKNLHTVSKLLTKKTCYFRAVMGRTLQLFT